MGHPVHQNHQIRMIHSDFFWFGHWFINAVNIQYTQMTFSLFCQWKSLLNLSVLRC